MEWSDSSVGKILFENMSFNSIVVLTTDSWYNIDPNLVLLMSKKCINLAFKNFTTFLWSTKYDLEIISFLTQLVKNEKERILNEGLANKLEGENDKEEDLYEIRSFYQ
jgi:hypothetical protein